MRSPQEDSQPRLGWTLALTSLGFFMVGLDALVVVTALPAIERDLGASLASLQWTVNAYSLAWAASITTAAALGDRYGRRRWFAIGLTLFAGASAACALAPGIQILVAARVVHVFAAFGSLASPTTFIAGFRPSFTMLAGLAAIGALAAFGVGTRRAVARAPSSPDIGGAQRLAEARAPGIPVHTRRGTR